MQPYHLKIHSERRRFWLHIKIYLIIFFVLLLGVGGIYLVRESPYFKVRSLKVVGLPDESAEKFLTTLKLEIFKRPVARLLGEDNYLSWPKELAPQNLSLSGIIIDKDLLDRSIVINVEKRERLGIWCLQTPINADDTQINAYALENIRGDPRLDLRTSAIAKQCWWFDKKDGLLFEEAFDTEGQLIFRISERTSDFLRLGSRVLDDSLFANFKKLLEVTRELDLSVKDITIDRAGQELTIITNQGAVFIFSLRFDATANTVPALKELLAKNPLATINYVDLTVENKIYLKLK